jgi:hypothetical protein
VLLSLSAELVAVHAGRFAAGWGNQIALDCFQLLLLGGFYLAKPGYVNNKLSIRKFRTEGTVALLLHTDGGTKTKETPDNGFGRGTQFSRTTFKTIGST